VRVIVPTIAFPFAMSFTVQVTVGFVSFATVAVKACVPLARTEGLEGVMATRFSPVDGLPFRPTQLAVSPATMQTKSVSPKRRTAASPVLIRKFIWKTLSTPIASESFCISETRVESLVPGRDGRVAMQRYVSNWHKGLIASPARAYYK